MSPLLFRLEEQLLVETDAYRVAELRARRAAYLARIGRFQEASEEIADLRLVFSDGRSGRVTALIMLAEAMVAYFSELASSAADRVARAKLLGHAMKDREVISLAAAWHGFFEFEQSKFQSAIRSVKQAMEFARPEDHAAWSRCAIVLLNCHALCGDTPSSQHWFQEGREHALKDGDQASVEALLHSKAVFGVAWLWSQRTRGVRDPGAIARVRLEVSSARNLQRLARIEAHASYIELAHARLLILEDKFDEALEALHAISGTGPFPVAHFNQGLLQLETAYCQAALGRVNEASAAYESSKSESLSSLDVDDRLVAIWMEHELESGGFGSGEQVVTTAKLESAIADHDELVTELRKLLAQ